MTLKNILPIKTRVKYLEHRDLVSNLNKLCRNGNLSARKASNAVLAIKDKIYSDHDDPFEGIKVTKHGETRIKYCIKYDLNDGYRLVTIKENKQVLLCSVGTHDDSEKWLERNKGLTLVAIPQGQIYRLDSVITKYDSEDPGMPRPNDKLVDALPTERKKQISNLAGDGEYYIEISELSFATNLERIKNVSKRIKNPESAEGVFSVLCAIRDGNAENAIKQLDLLDNKIKKIDELDEAESLKIQDGEHIKEIKIGSSEYTEIVKKIIASPHYQDWMLFMHPEQQKIVDKDFAGAALLSGVSGSGKTCIVVQRAIRLARATNSKVLVLTLNPALARLISELLDYASGDSRIRDLIKVKPFPDLCGELLLDFEPDHWKQYREETWKTNEHVDEVWREFYRCQVNNTDANILFPLHKRLIARGIDAETYIRQEFDWLRSLSVSGRDAYRTAERNGRAIPLGGEDRDNILAGMEAWERKLWEVGVSDYLNLSTALFRHIHEIRPKYNHVLVDEAQDFGTIELRLIKSITMEGGSNLFFAGDIAQTILPKHHDFAAAEITFSNADRLTLKKNYRNSKEILHAAHDVILHSIDKLEYVFSSKDLEILDPDYANRSSNKPCILDGGSLADEISYALQFARDYDESKKICLCFAGYTLLELSPFSKKYNFPVLDREVPLSTDKIFVSDLEQMKGFEFDCVVILNCSGHVIPNPYLPIEESFRDISRLYVAMTRAKTDLYVSFSANPSAIFEGSIDNGSFYRDRWEGMYDKALDADIEVPRHLPQFDAVKFSDISKLDGKAFLYTDLAIGLSKDLIEKIEILIDGRGRSNRQYNTRWRTMGAAYADVRTTPSAKKLFGRKTSLEFLDFYEKLQAGGR